MKRILSVLLTLMLILSSASIAVAENEHSDIDAYLDEATNDIVIKGTSAFGKGHIVSAAVKLDDELIYFNFSEAGENGAFEFRCKLDPLTDDTGLYDVTLGGAGISTASAPDDIIFVNSTDTTRIVTLINDSDTSNIETNITDENTWIDVDLSGDITQLTHPDKVYSQLVADTFINIPEIRRAFAAAVAVQTFNEQAASDNSLALLERYEGALGLDLDGIFADIKTATLKSDVYTAICGKNIILTKEKFKEEFEKAIYTALFNGLDSSDRDSLIPYIEACNEAGYSDIDLTKYNALSDEEQVQVIKDVIAAKNSNKFDDLTEVGNVFAGKIPAPEEEEEEETYNPPSPGRGGGGGDITIKVPAEKVTDEKTEPVMPSVTKFNDLESVKWAQAQIEHLASKGIINGKADGIYDPNGNITREELVKIIVSALDLPNETTENSFVDVTDDKWFYEPVMKAYALGIINGVDFDVFGAGQNITREQLCTIVYRALLLLDAEIKVEDFNTDISDKADVSEYALPAVEAMYRAGIVSGMGDGTFNPKGFATRAQAAKIIYEILEGIGRL